MELDLRPGAFVFVGLLALALSAPATRGQQPTSAPTSEQTVDDGSGAPAAGDSAIRQWFADLASRDGARRDAAVTDLMGLDRAELPRLQQLVRDSVPLAPEQAAALHDIVLHAYLASEPYMGDKKQGFLGLRWHTTFLEEPARLGVALGDRMPGFPAFRVLRPGDLILAVLIDPNLPPEQPPNALTTTQRLLADNLVKVPAHHEVTLEVLRAGSRIKVTVRLAARPVFSTGSAVSNDEVDLFFNQRRQKAELYWQLNFLPMMQRGVS